MLESYLEPWLARKVDYAQTEVSVADLDLDELGAFIWLTDPLALHEAGLIQAQSLENAWLGLRDYVSKACEVIAAEEPSWLDRDEAFMIPEALGPPPPQSHPLYLMTVAAPGEKERIVYVGKTSSRSSRFSGGHAAMTRLHHPDYSGLEKRIYPALVMFCDQSGSYLPLEAVAPLDTAKRLLSTLEAQLIHHFAPHLNVQGKRRYLAQGPMVIQIQSESETFLEFEMVFPPMGAMEPSSYWVPSAISSNPRDNG